MTKKSLWQYTLFFTLLLTFWILGYLYLGNARLSEDTAYSLQCSFFVFPLIIAFLAVGLSHICKINILWFSIGLTLMNCFFIWVNYFREDYLLNQIMNDLKNRTHDSIVIGNQSFYRGTLILDCYRESAPEYHFKAYGELFKVDEDNLFRYKKTLAAEMIDEYLEPVIEEKLDTNVRLITNSMHLALNPDADLTNPVKLIEMTKNMHLYCVAESDASPSLIDDVAKIITPYLWNTDCVLIVIYHNNPESINLFSSDFHKIPRIQKKITHSK